MAAKSKHGQVCLPTMSENTELEHASTECSISGVAPPTIITPAVLHTIDPAATGDGPAAYSAAPEDNKPVSVSDAEVVSRALSGTYRCRRLT